MKDVRITKNVKKIKFETVWAQLEEKINSKDNNLQNICDEM